VTGYVVATFAVLGLRVKTLGHHGLDGGACVVTLLRASSWSSDFPRTHFVVFGIFDLLCKRVVSSSPCICSTVYGFVYKAERKPVSRNFA
jgi:hypothetical protein